MTTNPFRLLLGGIVLIFTVGCLGIAGLNFAKLLPMEVQEMTTVNPYELSPGDQTRLMMSRRAELNQLTETLLSGKQSCYTIDVTADMEVLDADPFRRDYDKLVDQIKTTLNDCGAVAAYAARKPDVPYEAPDVTPSVDTASPAPDAAPAAPDAAATTPDVTPSPADTVTPAPAAPAPSKPSPDDPATAITTYAGDRLPVPAEVK